VPVNNGKSKKQLLEELIQAQKALEERVETQDQMIKRFESLASQEDFFVKVMNYFPYPIMVFSPDGKLETVNNTLLTETGIKNIETAINTLGALDFCFPEKTKAQEAMKRALSGETVFLYDVKDPLETLKNEPGVMKKEISGFYDIVLFPIKQNGDKASHVVVMLMKQNQE
jgi:AraC family transcriptional regulator